MLDHDDSVGTFGDGRSGHDFDGLTGPDDAGKDLAGTHLADDAELSWQFSGA